MSMTHLSGFIKEKTNSIAKYALEDMETLENT
jgi:hypothetical protein